MSEEVLKDVDALSGPRSNRSEFIETAVVRFVQHLRRERRNSADLDIINRRHGRLNREALDVLKYQVSA